MSSCRSISKDIKKILYGSASVLAGLGSMGVAHSQTAGQPIEEVVVKGIRYSLQQSIDAKRSATAVTDVLTAEDVGKFPDKNLAEALQRVPGVVINREFGEGERVNIRGTDTNLSLVMLNGHSVSSADWFILDQLDATRSFNYLLLPSDIIGQTTVYKTSQADLNEGGLGGTINVVTRNPLDLDPMTVYARVEGVYTELADSTDPNGSALFSWKNGNDTLGFLIAGVYQEREIRRDGVEVLGYFPVDTDPTAGVNNVDVPQLIGSALFQQKRVRKGGNIAVQFKPTDNLDFNLTGLYSKLDADNLNENYLAWIQRAIGNNPNVANRLTNTTVVDGTAVAGTVESLNGGTGDFGIVYDAIDRLAHSESRNIDLLTNIRLADDWNVAVRLGYTDAEGNTDAQPFLEFGAPGRMTYDLRGRAPQVSFIPNANGAVVDATDPTDLQFIFASLHEILNTDDETYGFVDIDKKMDSGVLKGLKFGAKYADHSRDLVFNATTYGGFFVPINTTPAATFAGGLTPSDYLDEIASSGTLRPYWQIDKGVSEDFLFDNLASGPGRVLYPQQSFSIKEKIYAGYIMGQLGGEHWRGNVGIRYVKTDQTSNGYVTTPTGANQNPFGAYDAVSIDHNYDDILPSLNIVYDMTDDILLRFALARVMTRPNYSDIAPRASLNPGALTGTGGNPELDPFRANQADLSIEWYPGAGTMFGAALFYKDVKSFITDSPETRNFNLESATSPNLACTAAGPNLWSCPFLINQRTNGSGGSIAGFEVNAVKPIWNGLGIQANYTFVDSEADDGAPLPGTSRDTFNAALYYENRMVSARLAYTYRSDFFVKFDRSTRLDEKSLDQVDASVVVNILDNVALTFDGINLTDEKLEQFADNGTRPRAIYDNGRTYYAGVKVSF